MHHLRTSATVKDNDVFLGYEEQGHKAATGINSNLRLQKGQTMDKVIVELERCHGTESPDVMLSRIKLLGGIKLRIIRPFSKTKIQCRRSEDKRLLTIVKLWDASESVRA